MNQLQHETSPYLLQHAHNPVDWYAWKPEAFERAKAENKPILVSIGYSTCHWCHVMERESFENEEVAALMNQFFINIKVDREERPDVDSIYMEACQFISGSGCGWPLNCFLTPDGRPFFAGTYYPPRQAYNRPSWTDVLKRIAYNFNERREVVEEQANQLTQMINDADNRLVGKIIEGLTEEQVFTPVLLQNLYHTFMQRADKDHGGFGGAPKFPSTMSLRYLLNYYYFTKETAALEQVEFSLNRMIQGGIYDQLGGGFARYTVDREWLVPHFEKMLYDNALLITLISDAYSLTQKDIYKETIQETLDFIAREMTSEEGGFYSAQDADSEGVEGKYYVWQKAEIEQVLGEEVVLFNEFYGVSEQGNWEEVNILWRAQSYEDFASAKGMEVTSLKATLEQNRLKLFDVRDQRIHPGLDDKILLDWNALMCTAYANAYNALGTESYKKVAVQNIAFVFEKMVQTDGVTLYHTYKDGKAQYDAFLNDYAFLIEALVAVYDITFDTKYLDQAAIYCEFVLEQFLDEESKLFYFTSDNQTDILLRKKDLYDSAVPSGNSTMVRNLQKLGVLLGKEHYRILAAEMLMKVQASVEQYPTSFGRWAQGLMNEVHPIHEIAIVGNQAIEQADALRRHFIPNKVVMATTKAMDDYPLLTGKPLEDSTLIYVCQNYTCQKPVETIDEAIKTIMS